MSYYVELTNSGKREKVTHFVYSMLISAYGYQHVIRERAFEVIRAGE